MTLHVCFVRHAETTANASRIIAGWSDVPLTARGRAHAARLRPMLAARAFDAAWSSDLSRAVDTARLAGFEPALDRRVRELDFGELDGAPWSDVVDRYARGFYESGDFVAPGGESLRDLRERVVDFVESLQTGRHVVFCHGGVMRTVLGELGEHRMVANCTVLDIDWRDRRVVAEERPPLPDDEAPHG
jgi:probable phosphoglycerate mutase